jgi:hypothetical protein
VTEVTTGQAVTKASKRAMLVSGLLFFLILPGLPLTGLPGTAQA